jgi:hypothetical protein
MSNRFQKILRSDKVKTMPADFPPTIVVVHPKENRRKCSLEPLRGRADLRFVEFSAKRALELPGYVRLAVDGPLLTTADANRGVLLIDGSWRHAARMHERFAAVPPRSLAGFRTAYPRVSKIFGTRKGDKSNYTDEHEKGISPITPAHQRHLSPFLRLGAARRHERRAGGEAGFGEVAHIACEAH